MEVRGEAGEFPKTPVELRTRARVRATLAATGVFGFAGGLPSGGAGLLAELGVTVVDRFSVLAHLELGTSIFDVIGLVGLLLEYSLTDHFSIALGGALSGWRPSGSTSGSEFWGPVFPVRLNFAPLGRGNDRTARRGLLFGVQFAPGFSLLPGSYYWPDPPSRFAFTAMVSVGYAIW